MIPVQYSTIASALPTDTEERKAVQLLADAIQSSDASGGGQANLVGSSAASGVEVYSSPNKIAGLVAGNNMIITKNNSENSITISTVTANLNGYQATLIQALQPNSVGIFDGTRTMFCLANGYLIDMTEDIGLHQVTIAVNANVLSNNQPNSNVNYANFAGVLRLPAANSNILYVNSGLTLMNGNANVWSAYPSAVANQYDVNVTGAIRVGTNANILGKLDIGTSLVVGTAVNVGTSLTVNETTKTKRTEFTEYDNGSIPTGGNATVDWGISDAQLITLANSTNGGVLMGQQCNIFMTNSTCTTKILRLIHSTVNVNVTFQNYATGNAANFRVVGTNYGGVLPTVFCPASTVARQDNKQTLISVYYAGGDYFITPLPFWSNV